MANKTVSLVEDLIADFLKENDLFLWDAEFVKEGRENDPGIQALLAALQSQEVKDFINSTYNGAVVPIF